MTTLLKNLTGADPVRADALARALPFFLFIAVLAVRGALPVAAPDPGRLDLRWLYAVQAAIAGGTMLALRTCYRELARPQIAAGPLFASLAMGLAVFVLWIAPLPDWTHLGAPVAAFVPVATDGTLRWDLIAARGIGAALVVPVMEELFWRSFVMRWIDKRDFLSLAPGAASNMALAASSAIFALAHDQWLCAFLAGLVYGQLYRRTGNIWYSVVAHGVTNLALAVWVVSTGTWRYW